MPGREEIERENFIILVFSGLGTALGIMSFLGYTSDAFGTINFWFFIISCLFMVYCLYIDTKPTNNYHAPQSPMYNPHFHNIITFASFALTGMTSILYIFDTVILHLDILGHFIENKELGKTINSITGGKQMQNILMWVEIFILPELFLRLICSRSFGYLFVFLIYVVFISMFSFSISSLHRSSWIKIYNFFRKELNKAQGNYRQFLLIAIQISDKLSEISQQIYPISKFR
ncbi:hypothetical protein TRFO_15754 [Tritrichomonas foetus]|uniref:Uncharacterized protein n=1 Tax=Tritrichomonas foetus TaxID=1144522 RepID=A0A1J4KWR5_9EUKA|nr:hypothetical protein TRFO_15754 [Tritrichomonas foetus]|eukprot:OHT13981.1 hypothetical protein TRFO_15754 [Tritrichomonas foetus]